VIILLIPTSFVVMQVARQATGAFRAIDVEPGSGIDTIVDRIGDRIGLEIDWREELEQLRPALQRATGAVLSGGVWAAINAVVTLFLLFYFLRDHSQAKRLIQRLLPLADREAEYLFEKAHAMIQHTLYGTLLVSAVQGALGGLMFWFLGLPGPFLWGVVMGLLSIVPVLGAFVIWIPAAVFLALQGSWVKAGILMGWGTVVVGLIDNWLYPVLVGKATRVHAVPMFVALVGGLVVFGAAGLVLGPLVLAVTWSLLEILKERIAEHEANIEESAESLGAQRGDRRTHGVH
jgi:predicted PurR-regulated permease PerM